MTSSEPLRIAEAATTDVGLRRIAQAWLAAGQDAVEVLVTAAQGSVPRAAGTRMLVAADAVAGTIGGGHLEQQAITEARAMLTAAPAATAPVRRIALGPSLGQCCGGVVTLRWQRLRPASLAEWTFPPPRFDLQLFGAGHVGRAIVALLAGIDCRVNWIDEREAEFPVAADPQHIVRCVSEAPEAEVTQAAPGSCFLVLTHSHDLDLRIVDAVLRRGDYRWLGLIGSATKRERFAHRLAHRGHLPEAIQRIVCPIGIKGIPGKQPAVIAIATVAQLLQFASPQAGPDPEAQVWASCSSAAASRMRTV
jgi:xanthine dehydrogenase accessory factor